MSFRIEQIEAKHESFSEYKYRIYENDRLIAYYWHDYRGEEHGIEFLSGTSEEWPVGRMTEFIEGGGPQPLRLTEQAVAYLSQRAR